MARIENVNIDGTDYDVGKIASTSDLGVVQVGSGLTISSGGVLSATGGGVADSVAWGHITGTMADQTDLTTALGAKANSADLATVATSGDYDDLTDKPTIGNATLTIQKNGTSAGTFTANATSNKTINITVPTTAADVSALPASTKYGASIAVSINTTDYKVTTTLKDQDGNTLGTAQVIDLPLESVVVNGSYDSTNKKIVLTLQNGNTIDIPVGDLVAGLQSEITSTNKLASDLVDDTNQTHKFVTAAQITKLNGIATGAEVNQNAFSNVKVGSTTVAADTKTDTLELVAGSNVTLTPDATNDKVTIAATDTTYSDATTSASGLMSASDKTKLNGIATGAEVNVQSDWDQTTTTADDYIKNKPTLATVATSGSYNDLSNKPTIPTVNNGTLTVQKNGASVATFTANQSGNSTANITVPTKTSDLTNDSGFLDSVAWGDVTGKPTFATVATSGSYNDLSNKPTIPAAQVQSDWNQTTTTAVDFIKNKPTKVSDFTNDAGYITSYTDTQVTQTRVDPDTTTTFYPVASTSSSTNTGDVKKFSAVKLNYASDDGGYAELELGQNSYYDPVGGELTLWNMGTTQRKTTLHRGLGETNQTFNLPYNADSTSGTLVANGARNAATGSATQPVYADATGILHPTTYALNKTVPSNAVFTDTTYSDATTSASGLMSAADKSKLNSIAAGAEINVQANWAQTTETADDYIRNKPTIPTVNNGTLTIQKNGTNVQTFTANQSTNATANIAVPTKTSELTNDSSFVTSSGTVAKADQLTTARTIAIGTGATGTATSFNGSSNITIPITSVKEAYLEWGDKALSGQVSPVDAALDPVIGSNKWAFAKAESFVFEYSTNGGSTWTSYGSTDNEKRAVTSTASGTALVLGKGSTTNYSQNRLRLTFNSNAAGGDVYTSLRKILVYLSTNGASGTQVTVQSRTIGNYLNNVDTWTTVGTYNVSGWSGWNSIPYNVAFGGSTTQTGQIAQIRLTFSQTGGTNNMTVYIVHFVGVTNWSVPSELGKTGHLYSWDVGQNATFPANVNITGSLGHGSYTYTLPNKNGTVAMTSDLPAAQVNSDWNASSGVAQILNKPTLATVATSGSYNDLSNKPTIPTVNDATLTIQKNGSTVKTFTANASSNVTANITVPTKTSDLTNDSNFVASTALATVATSGSYNDLSNKPTIPTVNNATLTIQKNGSTVKTFTANASSNVTANITVPTALSDLSGTVATSQIADGAVTPAKIALGSLFVAAPTLSSLVNVAANTNTDAQTITLGAGTWQILWMIRGFGDSSAHQLITGRLVAGSTEVQAIVINALSLSGSLRYQIVGGATVSPTASTTYKTQINTPMSSSVSQSSYLFAIRIG